MKRIRLILAASLPLLLFPALALGAEPVRIVYQDPELPDLTAEESMLLLTLEAGPEGILLEGLHAAPMAPKLRHGGGVAPGALFRALGVDGTVLYAGQFSIPWTLHGDDLVDEDTGELECLTVHLDRVVFVVKLPWVEGLDRVSLHQLQPPLAGEVGLILDSLASPSLPAGIRDLGEIRLADRLRVTQGGRLEVR